MADHLPNFFDERRLVDGPWRAFERDVARLMMLNGFEDVRLVGGPGDRGADVLGTKNGALWVIQCKFTSGRPPAPSAADEVVTAARFYSADRMVVACSRKAGSGLLGEIRKYGRLGVKVELLDPSAILKFTENSSDYPTTRRELREYQTHAVESFESSLLETGRGQIVLATGLGKTVVMAETVAQLFRGECIEHGRVLVLAHTLELVDQLQFAFWHQLPKWVPTHRLVHNERPAFWDGITFATVQSAKARLSELPDFGLILVDEAHHVGAATYLDVVEQLKPAMIGGATATPWRGDEFDIDQLIGPPCVQYGIEEGLRLGFLCDVDYRLLADGIDWELVQAKSQFGYSLTQLNTRLILSPRDDEAARLIADTWAESKRNSGIIFTRSIAHAEHIASSLRHYELRAEALSSQSDARQREKLMSAFRRGEIDVLATVDLFNEGVDVPDVDLLVFMRVTHSRRIFVQQLGRGLRVGKEKTGVIVLDFVTDLRRLSDVVELDSATRGGPTERLGLGANLIQFRDESAGSFLLEWVKDQAALFQREGDPVLELPRFEYPKPIDPGNVQ